MVLILNNYNQIFDIIERKTSLLEENLLIIKNQKINNYKIELHSKLLIEQEKTKQIELEEKTKQIELIEKTKQIELEEKTKQIALEIELIKLDLEMKKLDMKKD